MRYALIKAGDYLMTATLRAQTYSEKRVTAVLNANFVDINTANYDALLIPGGRGPGIWYRPVLAITKEFADAVPIAGCHGCCRCAWHHQRQAPQCHQPADQKSSWRGQSTPQSLMGSSSLRPPGRPPPGCAVYDGVGHQTPTSHKGLRRLCFGGHSLKREGDRYVSNFRPRQPAEL
jgi:hypothetical protein